MQLVGDNINDKFNMFGASNSLNIIQGPAKYIKFNSTRNLRSCSVIQIKLPP
jgi:hypothetical protein